MTLYAAIIYSADLDWSQPEQAAEAAQYGAFSQAAAAVMRGGAALYPTSTATTVRVSGGKGGDVLTGRRVLATLVRTTGSWELAEDAVQDAVVRALETWPRDGVPGQPRAWLTLTARRRAIDLLRREHARAPKQKEALGCSTSPPRRLTRSSGTTCSGWSSPAATRRCRRRRRSHWRCGRSAASAPRRPPGRCSSRRRSWPSG